MSNKIEPVDFVWAGGLLTRAVPTEQHAVLMSFLASHVIASIPMRAVAKRMLLETHAQIEWLSASEPQWETEQGGLSTGPTPLMYEAATAALERTQQEIPELHDRCCVPERRASNPRSDG